MIRNQTEVQDVIDETVRTLEQHKQICGRQLDLTIRENYEKLIDMGEFIILLLKSFLANEKIESQFKNEEWRIAFRELAAWYFEPYSEEAKKLDKIIKEYLKPMPETSDVDKWIYGDYPITHLRAIIKDYPNILATIYSPVKRTIREFERIEYLTTIKADLDRVLTVLTSFERYVILAYICNQEGNNRYDTETIINYLLELRDSGMIDMEIEINAEVVLKTLNKSLKKMQQALTKPKFCENWYCSECNYTILTVEDSCPKCGQKLEVSC